MPFRDVRDFLSSKKAWIDVSPLFKHTEATYVANVVGDVLRGGRATKKPVDFCLWPPEEEETDVLVERAKSVFLNKATKRPAATAAATAAPSSPMRRSSQPNITRSGSGRKAKRTEGRGG